MMIKCIVNTFKMCEDYEGASFPYDMSATKEIEQLSKAISAHFYIDFIPLPKRDLKTLEK